MVNDDAQEKTTNMGTLSQMNAETLTRATTLLLVNMKAAPPMHIPTPTVHAPVHLFTSLMGIQPIRRYYKTSIRGHAD